MPPPVTPSPAQGGREDVPGPQTMVRDLPESIHDLNPSEVLACMGWDRTAYHRVQWVKLARHFKIAYPPAVKTDKLEGMVRKAVSDWVDDHPDEWKVGWTGLRR